ncbi:hypothetical protein IMSHALPRED_001317 [Imshaugia aleurites]|uniref:Uncharacterized protein n=1 Tax=Imshaugia aleurites TaxID=172621 RepID=A0A8H3J2G0_9LECA|nr:hypothetical protein IMSHALPRED_001317 [Imshaugia aleurites]
MALTNMGFFSTAPKPSQKRKSSSIASDSDSDAPMPATKKVKGPTNSTKAATPSATTSYNANDLEHLSHAELIAHAIYLQKRLDASKKSSSTSGNARELSPEELQKKVERLRALMVRQIKKAMTWKPSCKTGSATFSQDFPVQHPQIITKLFARVIKDNGKAWKMKKLSPEDFEGAIGSIDASVRYDYLELTSDVTIPWDTENGTVKCSGKYGKPGTGVLNMKQAASVESD